LLSAVRRGHVSEGDDGGGTWRASCRGEDEDEQRLSGRRNGQVFLKVQCSAEQLQVPCRSIAERQRAPKALGGGNWAEWALACRQVEERPGTMPMPCQTSGTKAAGPHPRRRAEHQGEAKAEAKAEALPAWPACTRGSPGRIKHPPGGDGP